MDDESPPAEGVHRWWSTFLPRTTAQVLVGLLALVFVAAAAGFAFGTRYDSDSRDDDSVDVGFLYDMVAHHEQAILLAGIELRNGGDDRARVTAMEILRSQSYEIGLMEMRLGNFGHAPAQRPQTAMGWMGNPVDHAQMAGMASSDELDALRSAQGADADALFYALMIDHHRGGVAMASHASRNADDEWVKRTAAAMARIQSGEIVEMEHARDDAGLPSAPAGFTTDFPGDD